jgi:FtsP/CotA-like multicopper oxidase with cupredoxin domain
MRVIWLLAVLLGIFVMPVTSRADEHTLCGALDHAFPQPGRFGGGENSFRPLPDISPVRSQPGAPGTISLSIAVNHVDPGEPKGRPAFIYEGNYQVSNIPVFRLIRGANTDVTVTEPESGRTYKISDGCLASPDWIFGGTTWALVQGDTLDVMLQSHLDYQGSSEVYLPVNGAVPCRSSNLHTHGLLVPPYHPRRAGKGPYGDYVLDVTQPHDSFFDSEIDNCGTKLGGYDKLGHGLTGLPLHYVDVIPGRPGENSLDTGKHPSGLYYYHPHPHGFSGMQIGGGTTGAITIGALTDYACPEGDGTPGHCTLTNTNVRIMNLKDDEIQASGTAWSVIPNYESGLCAPTGGTREGECQGTEGALGPTKAVFTINGVQYPVVRVPAGKMEIWRLINSGRTLTYDLSIVGEGPGHPVLPFQVLAEDGVSVKQPNGHAVIRTQMLMMPSSRIEIAIPAPPDGGTFRLHNSVVQTGGNGHGDIWPAVDLARFTWDKPAPGETLPPARPFEVIGPHEASATPIPHIAQVVDGEPGPCTFKPGDKRLIYYVHRFVTVYNSDQGGTRGGLEKNKNEVFGLIAGIQHADGTQDFYNRSEKGVVLHSIHDVWAAGRKDGDPAFPAFMHNDWGDVCTVKGNVEPWELINFTGEDHNFHIHQGRFTLDPNGEFHFPDPHVSAEEYLKRTDRVLRAFADPLVLTYNDNIPVPRGQTDCADDPGAPGCKGKATTECTGAPDLVECPHPGKMSVIMDFSRAEQVGTYVYHCHIMEHEDGGMMAMIHVLCPRGDASCAAQETSQAMCHPADGG